MRALLEQVGSRSQRRGQLSVYHFQKTYALWLGLVLFIYSVLLFGFAFAAPFVLPALKLVAPLPLEELRAQPVASGEHLPPLEGALKGSEHLEDVLQRFRFAEPR
ncbi:hypothetical protein MYX04_06045 [Nitrospiraceae bacterium AH_259_D15_M11_P09]|nr:hypothetical protein [Nitrospiraceae bacterium AH_259_D15_M11_P09]